MNLISLMVISLSLSACYDPKGKLIYKTDLKLGECRVYEVTQSKPELVFVHKQTLPLEACDNKWGVDNKTLAEIVKEWNAEQQKGD